MWVYSTLAHTDFHMTVTWRTSADASISTSTGAAVSLAAGTWTYIEQELTAPATASKADFFIQQGGTPAARSEGHTSELQSLMRISYAVFCLKKKKQTNK